MAEVYINKLTAANRQLRSAIRMFFLEEDDLAVHTVVSAAYQIICDLKSKRGRQEAGDYILTQVFYLVRDYRRGKLSSVFSNDPPTMRWIRDMAEQLPITATSEYKDVKAFVSRDDARIFWKERKMIANFLKHAYFDKDEMIRAEEIDNLQLLILAVSSYTHIDDISNLGIEGVYLYATFVAKHGFIDGVPEDIQQIASYLEPLSHGERLKFCSDCLNQLNADST